MGERVIKTGLSKKYKDMLDAVIGQMSDGYWENIPMMRGYWKFVKTGTAGDEGTLNVDETSGARYGDSRIDNRFYGMPDDAVKKFFADKIKFLIKEEGLGKWDRGNESETDYLSYGRPRYRVKDGYYAYEILKGRNARKHPEYGDVAESFSESSISKGQHNMRIKFIKKNESYESDLEDIAQSSGEIDYGDAMALDRAAAGDGEIRKKVRDLIMDWRSAAEDGDDEEMTKAAKALKTLADSLPKHEARMHLGRCKNCGRGWTKTNYLDELEPAVRKYFKDKGYPDNADICPKCVAAAKDYLAKNATVEAVVKGVKDKRANEKRVMDTSEPYEISRIKEYMAKKGWTWNFNDKNNHFWFTKGGASKIEGDLVPWLAYTLTNGNDIYVGRSLRNWKADLKAIGLHESNSNEAFDGWDGWEDIEGLENALDGIENLTYELRSCVRGAKTGCEDWKALALYIKGLAANLDDAAEEMAYRRDDEDESKKKKKNPSKDFSSTVEEDEDGRKLSH